MKVRTSGQVGEESTSDRGYPYEGGREMISFKKHFKIRRVMACLHVDGNNSVEERMMKKNLTKNV